MRGRLKQRPTALSILSRQASIVKLTATDTAMRVVTDAVQDTKVTQIFQIFESTTRSSRC